MQMVEPGVPVGLKLPGIRPCPLSPDRLVPDMFLTAITMIHLAEPSITTPTAPPPRPMVAAMRPPSMPIGPRRNTPSPSTKTEVAAEPIPSRLPKDRPCPRLPVYPRGQDILSPAITVPPLAEPSITMPMALRPKTSTRTPTPPSMPNGPRMNTR